MIVEVVIRIERGVGRGRGDFAQVEPVIQKCFCEALCFRVVEQALRLRAQHLRPIQFLARREVAQRVIGR